MSLIIGDCIAIALLELKAFKSKNFKNFHPGGNLGKDLKYVSEIMHKGSSLPIVAKFNEKNVKSFINND